MNHQISRSFIPGWEFLKCSCGEKLSRLIAEVDIETWVQQQRAFTSAHPDPSVCGRCGGVGRIHHMPEKVGTSPRLPMGWNRCHICLAEGSTACQACGYFGVHWAVIGEPFRLSEGSVSGRVSVDLMGCPRCKTVRMEART